MQRKVVPEVQAKIAELMKLGMKTRAISNAIRADDTLPIKPSNNQVRIFIYRLPFIPIDIIAYGFFLFRVERSAILFGIGVILKHATFLRFIWE